MKAVTIALAVASRYWREVAIAGLVAFIVGACRARDVALEARGRALEQARVADSTLTAVQPKLARVDSLIVHDTIRVARAIARVVRQHDTVLLHLTDTVIVKENVARTDSAMVACSDMLGDCVAFRRYANTTIQALEAKLSAQPAMVARSCVGSNVVWAAIAGTAVGMAGRAFHR